MRREARVADRRRAHGPSRAEGHKRWTPEPPDFDIAIIGSGMVGASIAYFAAPKLRVLLLEAEPMPGHHATGRSAALFTEAYGPPSVRALTRASRTFFDAPPDGFSATRLLTPRGSLLVGGDAQRAEVMALHDKLVTEGSAAKLLERDAIRALVPVLREEAAALAVHDEAAFDIEVDALLQGFLRGAKAAGATLATDARVQGLARRPDHWRIDTVDGRSFAAACIVNAAGAWVDQIAALAGLRGIGIEPRRRSAFLFAPPDGIETHRWPAVIAIDESWYFKPDAGLLLGSPANANPVVPHDVVAEEFDVALGIYNIEAATTLRIRRPKSTWAGLRSFVADGEPVCGFDAAMPGFFWAAALGGYGIQSAPAFGRLCAGLLIGTGLPDDIAAQSLVLSTLSTTRDGLGHPAEDS